MLAVPDPDLEMGGGGGGHPVPLIRGEGQSLKTIISALQASVWSKNRRGGPDPLDPSLESATGWSSCVQCTTLNRMMESTTGRIQPPWHSEQIFPSLYVVAVI